MDPEFTSDGQPYGPIKYKQIARERYIISKHCNTSYLDVGNISVLERQILLSIIKDELDQKQEAIEKHKKEMESKKRHG